MPGQERLLELLERWEELHQQGEEISARELCAQFPELQPEVQQALEKLKKANYHLNLETPQPAPLSAPEHGSANRSSPWPWRGPRLAPPGEKA